MDDCMDGTMDVYVCTCMDGWMDGWVYRWMDRIDVCAYMYVHKYIMFCHYMYYSASNYRIVFRNIILIINKSIELTCCTLKIDYMPINYATI